MSLPVGWQLLCEALADEFAYTTLSDGCLEIGEPSKKLSVFGP